LRYGKCGETKQESRLREDNDNNTLCARRPLHLANAFADLLTPRFTAAADMSASMLRSGGALHGLAGWAGPAR
jgi:hypothetical protein